MKVCNWKRLIKYLLAVSLTSFVTTIIFHFVHKSKNDRSASVFLHNSNILSYGINRNSRSKMIGIFNPDLISKESSKRGIGENGKPAKLPDDHDKHMYNELYRTNGFNALLSDYISVNRSVPDIRHPKCKHKKYKSILPDVSVIVPFHNEHWSTLLRTVYSVLNRSPPKLLKEIILVDDSSTKNHCKKPLDDYVLLYLPKVKVIHLKTRQGLIRARLTGAENATGKVLLFLDSHTEANENWLLPLLDPIATNNRTCVCPFIDVIDYETFEYRAQDEGARGAFDWELFYKRLPLLPEDRKDPTKPFKSPVMAGGLFAISKRFFEELGSYDPGLDIWGGEQYELSFKIWQCGGLMVDAPCSRVGHIYRKFAPFPNPEIGDFVGRNYKRVAEVWMDEYAEYLYQRRPHYRNINPGDLSNQLKIRERLKCKPFKWFMKEVAFDLINRYPPIEPQDYGRGKIKSLKDENLCLAADKGSETVKLMKCSYNSQYYQSFLLSWHKDIRVEHTSYCFDVSKNSKKAPVNLFKCHNDQGNQLWRYNLETSQLIFGLDHKCMSYDSPKNVVFVEKCNNSMMTQKWSIDSVNKDALMKWHKQIPVLD